MENYRDIKNRQLQLMLEPARERLKKYTIEELCQKGKIVFLEQSFLIQSMGDEILVRYPDFVIEVDLEMWHHLTLLQYMDTADGTPLSGKWIGLQQMRGGLSRGRGFDKDISTMFERYFEDVNKETFKQVCLKLGAEIIDGKADVTAKIFYAPSFPVLVNFWEGDDEFPPSGKVLVDEKAEHYLTIEAAGGACSAVIGQIRNHVLHG